MSHQLDLGAPIRTISFGTRLRRLRDAAGLTQEELAERSGLTPNAVSGLERGEHRYPYPSTVRALSEALGLSEAERADLAASVPKRNRTRADPAVGKTSTATNLPLGLSSLVGREQEVEAISSLLQRDGFRLITLTGPGGVGKTSLALKIANQVTKHFADGVVFVPLAAVRDPALVASTIAQSLSGIDPDLRLQVDRLGDTLRDRHVLLVLDNFEHLLEAAPIVTTLLMQCPQLSVIATSRAALRLAGERDIPISPLALPDQEHMSQFDEVADIAAIRLFVERAREVDPAFRLSADNAAAVAAICHRLDGLPLAIELAAARSTLFTPAAMLPRLAQRLPLLTAGRRDAPERHRTMYNALAWSGDLLAEGERTLLRRLAVFVGGFSLEAAEALAAAMSGDGVAPYPTANSSSLVLDELAALVDQSLVRHEPGPGGVPRYVMLETIREFALEQLEEAGEGSRARDAHAAIFAELDERLDPNRLEPHERVDDRLLRIEADHPNCRAALTHLAAVGDVASVLRLAGALAVLWQHRGHLREGRQWLEWALERTADAAPIWRGRALAGLSLIAWAQGDLDRAGTAAEAARLIARTYDDGELLALSIHMLGLVDVGRGDWDRAEGFMNEALERQLAIGTPGYGANALVTLSAIAHRRGDVETSGRYAEQALEMFREVGHAGGAATALNRLASLAIDRGDDYAAFGACREALLLCEGIGARDAIASTLIGLAALASVHGQAEQAATLIGVVDARLDESGAEHHFGDRRHYDQAVATVRALLGNDQFARLHASGRALTSAAAVAAGLAVTVPDPAEASRDLVSRESQPV